MFETPFKGKLAPSEIDARSVQIKNLKNRPDVLLREQAFVRGANHQPLIESMNEAKKMFEQIGTYGVNVVRMNFVVGKNELGDDSFFTIVDKIYGDNLAEIKTLPESAKEELDKLYAALAKYYADAKAKKTKYWGDCKNDQFVYGHKHGEQDSHFYLVDVEPLFYSPDDEWNKLSTLEHNLGTICRDLVDSEAKFKPKVRFESRAQVLAIVEKMLQDNPESKPLQSAKQILLAN